MICKKIFAGWRAFQGNFGWVWYDKNKQLGRLLHYGIIPVIAAKMEQRPLKIHVVGVEKELNFLDMFKEFAFLLPHDLKVIYVFNEQELDW